MSVAEALKSVRQRMELAYARRTKIDASAKVPKLVAVSKTKPVEAIESAYQSGQRDFGENYIKELVEKSQNCSLKKNCPEIRWHFIGHLQRNKVSSLLSAANLHCLQTLDSIRLAEALNNGMHKAGIQLQVFVQVNTSQETNKSGIEPNELVSFVKYIIENCDYLKFSGLMTIGSLDNVHKEDNFDFNRLIDCKQQLINQLQLNPSQIELSMGMSNDFERAIECGSTIVRVGSSIFGDRSYNN